VSDDSGFYSRPGTSGLPVLLALVLANLLTREPLESLRPKADALSWSPPGQEERVTSRLWQDPIAVAYEEVAKSKRAGGEGGPIEAEALLEQVTRDRSRRGGLLTVIPVMVRGGSWPESRERRLRSRYATVIGFAEKQYYPVDDLHLGVCSIDWRGGAMIVPFEWFQNTGDEPGRALVLWIDEPALGSHPLFRLEGLLRQVLPEDPGIQVAILGPSNSTTLLRMVRDDQLLGQMSSQSSLWPLYAAQLGDTVLGTMRLKGARLLSSWSTMKPEGEDLAALRGEQEWSTELSFVRYIGTDDLLVGLLQRELKLRIPALARPDGGWTAFESFMLGTRMLQPAMPRAKILILSEADTDYGRAFEKEFKSFPVDVEQLRYLRGVDGQVPGHDLGAPKVEELLPEEAAIGRSQLDYLRRMERQLSDRGDHYDAVGVLGSDLYDKLAILKAVRSNFPGAVVFTTDLDARLLPTRASPETLNLLVASHHGLTLPPPREGPAEGTEDAAAEGTGEGAAAPALAGLSFRSGYQLALAAAAMDAVSPSSAAADLGWADRASIYEIGRNGPRELASGRGEAAADTAESGRGACRPWVGSVATRFPASILLVLGILSLRPVRQAAVKLLSWGTGSRRTRLGRGFLLTAGVVLVWWWLWPEARAGESAPVPTEFSATSRHMASAGVVLALVAFLLLLLEPVRTALVGAVFGATKRLGVVGSVVFFSAVVLIGVRLVAFMEEELVRPSGEPFALVEGISIWPTELIRAFVALYCILAAIRCGGELATRQEEIGRELLQLEPQAQGDLESRLGVFGIFRRRDRKGEKGTSIRDAWLDYCAETLPWPTLARVLVCSVAYYTLTGLMFKTLGSPGVPSRGWEAFVADRFLLWLSVATMVALIFFVVDAILSTARFLRRLRDLGVGAWPSTLRDEHAGEFDLPGTEVAEVLGVRLVERVTVVVSSLLYYPAIALFLMAFSRSGIFDNWTWSIALVLTFVLGFGVLLISARLLSFTAKALKSESLARLERGRIHDRKDKVRVADAEAAAAVIGRIRGGAFANLREHPLVRVLLLPFAGLGAASLLEFAFPLWLQM